MPQGTHNYFKQLDPRAGAIRPEDPEFEAQVRARIGHGYANRVDASRAGYVEPIVPIDTLGINIDDGEENRRGLLEKAKPWFEAPALSQLMDAEKNVFGIGDGASATTYAHEFRHRAGIKNELANRLRDLVYSGSQPQYINNVRSMFEELFKVGAAPDPRGVSFKDKESTVLGVVRDNLNVDFDQPPLEQLNKYPFLHFLGSDVNPANPGERPERQGVTIDPADPYARGGAVSMSKNRRSTWRDYASNLAGGLGAAGELYNTANTLPVLSMAGGASDAAAASSASALPTAADLGVAVDPSMLSSALGVLGVFNTAVNVLGGETFQNWIHGPNHHPTRAQIDAVHQVLLTDPRYREIQLPRPWTPGVTGWTFDGNILNNEQIWRLATGRSIAGSTDNPIRINWNTGQVTGTPASDTPTAGEGSTPQDGTDIEGNPVVFNEEGVLGNAGVWDIINAGGSGTPGTDTGNYGDYPTTGGVTGGTPTPTGTGSWDEILAGAGGAGVFSQVWDWVKNKFPEAASGEGALSDFTSWFGDLPWYVKAGLGAGVLGAIGDSATPNEYNPNPPPKFPGQPETITPGPARTALAPNIDYYTYGQRPGVAFFSDVNVPAQPSPPLSPPPPATGIVNANPNNPGNNPAKPNWLPGVPTYKARGGALSQALVSGIDSGRADTIDARLSPGEYVIDAETVSLLGDGNNEAGARKLDAMRRNVRKHKGKALARGQFSADAREPEHYLRARK